MSDKDNPVRILLVENETDYSRLVGFRLARSNTSSFDVEYANTLQAALDRIARGGIDGVLLDLNLADCMGIETFQRLHARFPELPVVILTAAGDNATALEAIREGAQDFLTKDHFQAGMLARTIAYAMERQRNQQELDALTKQLQAANARLEGLVIRDPLTELLNRRGLEQALAREARWASRSAWELAVLLLDLDNFKRINDTWGYATGDVVLKEIAQRLKSSLRTTDYLSRIGGDEFMILLPQTRMSEGIRIAEKLRLALARTSLVLSSGVVVRVTGSFGLTALSPDMLTLDEILAKTHSVLRQSKQTGRNRVSYKSGTGEEENAPSFELSRELRESSRFRAVAQPIMNLSNGTPIGYEFLSRSSIEGFEMPEDFFRASLEANLLSFVDRQCFKTCAAAARSLPRYLRRHLNLFPSTLIGTPVPELLEDLPSPREKLSYCIEISEQQIIGNPSYLAGPVQALKGAQVSIAVDDVGFGQSCLESLILLKPDLIKIDIQLVRGIARNTPVEPLRRLLKVSQALEGKVVAEGVETQEDLALLKDLGVEYGQGFLWGHPADASRV